MRGDSHIKEVIAGDSEKEIFASFFSLTLRRGHTVLANTLPKKEEHVLLCRMTEIQRKLYSTFMAELAASKAMANPLKAFAICCKVSFASLI